MGNSTTKEQRLPNGQPQPRSHQNYQSRAHFIARAEADERLGLGRADGQEIRRETKVERDARRLERDRQARLKEREWSVKEESVDGGYLVTLGVYTGIEDFSKPVVRQLMIERRLAPFFKGLPDHDESWLDHQLVAAVRGEPIPAADEIPTLEEVSSPVRPRAKTLATLAVTRQLELPQQEVHLPKDPTVFGRPIEAVLYKEAIDCPICFLSYPPFLNKTRCCDQPICSECFVQIKRADPHPPEHEETPENGEITLVSEPASCPFCKQPEFGVTYEPPPFKRGIVYPNANSVSAVSSNSSLSSSPNGPISPFGHSRRRTTSISASAPQVITTDRVRPDWAQKLATARAHAARRAAAATALHTAAYMMGNQETRGFPGFGRRRRERENTGSSVLPIFTERYSARDPRRRVVDLEEMMMLEAIRLSIADEEERQRKEDKDKDKDKPKDKEPRHRAESDPGKGKEREAPAEARRHLSASSSASSLMEPALAMRLGNASGDTIDSRSGTPSLEPMFNFQSLAAMIDKEEPREKPDVPGAFPGT